MRQRKEKMKRKDAKAQRSKEKNLFCTSALLCAFAPLRLILDFA